MDQPLNILEEDDKLVCVDKPAGLETWSERGGESAAILLAHRIPKLRDLGAERRFGAVHRLDKDTSGVLLFAKTVPTYEFLQEQFRIRSVEKRYLCLVTGVLKQDAGEVQGPMGRSPNDRRKRKLFLPGEPGSEGKRDSLTQYRILERLPGFTLVEAHPKTGRTHQLRVHFSSLGHPLAGDALYGFKGQRPPHGLTRQFLHASLLAFPDEKRVRRTCEAPLPDDLKRVIQSLRT